MKYGIIYCKTEAWKELERQFNPERVTLPRLQRVGNKIDAYLHIRPSGDEMKTKYGIVGWLNSHWCEVKPFITAIVNGVKEDEKKMLVLKTKSIENDKYMPGNNVSGQNSFSNNALNTVNSHNLRMQFPEIYDTLIMFSSEEDNEQMTANDSFICP